MERMWPQTFCAGCRKDTEPVSVPPEENMHGQAGKVFRFLSG